MIKIGKPYSVAEIKALLGDDYFIKQQKYRVIPKKPVISDFSELSEYDKNVYRTIRDEIVRCNRNRQHVKVYATGSRVTGTWKTKEEAEALAADTKQPVKYSDYDYWTDAPVKPNALRFQDITGEQVDCVHGTVLISIPSKENDLS